ncbi:unnamed protein product [Mytilus edulis]|uniref:Uncharacterized protein n=1 Tax=Mytilus edulis TaxID=6550 RepID=A0A8S3UIL4_MYTED|nr:unnamed protein product [Mytilus edulis]
MGLDDFYNFFMHLGMTTIEYDGLNFRYFSNPLDFMLMGLFEWRNKTNLESTATFGKLQEALTAIKLEHYLCQVHREDHSLVEKAHSRLQDLPTDDVINSLTEQTLIGDCVVHLGVELGLTIGNIKGGYVQSSKRFKWSNTCSSHKMEKMEQTQQSETDNLPINDSFKTY